jgi:hypothetical protein
MMLVAEPGNEPQVVTPLAGHALMDRALVVARQE